MTDEDEAVIAQISAEMGRTRALYECLASRNTYGLDPTEQDILSRDFHIAHMRYMMACAEMSSVKGRILLGKPARSP